MGAGSGDFSPVSRQRSTRAQAPSLLGNIMSWKAAAALLFSGLAIRGVKAQGGDLYDPRQTFCGFNDHRATIIGSRLYVDGGEWVNAKYFVNGTNVPVPVGATIRWQNEHLWKLDLGKSWSSDKPPWEVEEKPEGFDNHYNGAEHTLWNLGDGKMTTVGGWFSLWHGPPPGDVYRAPILENSHYKLPDARMFTYDASSSQWSSVKLDRGVKRVGTISFTTNIRKRVGFTLGGQLVNEEQDNTWPGGSNFLPAPVLGDKWLDTMTSYDFKTQKWETSQLPTGIGMTTDGVLHSLDRVGKDGALVFLTGEQKLLNGTNRLRPNDNIWVYDIDGKKWYSQKATGDIPSARRSACSVVVPAPDMSSYQIYLFSGQNNQYLLDMYVLSVPSFVWTKIPLDGYPNTWGVHNHACTLYSDRQMIVVPGTQNVSTGAGEVKVSCNSNLAVNVFDTTDWKWKSSFDPTLTENKVPEAIVSLVGGDTKGNANLNQPRAGFDDDGLKTLFSTRNQPIDYNGSGNQNNTDPTNSQGSNTSNTSGDDKDSGDGGDKNSNTGAIVGGVVGGVAAVALVFGALLFWRRRERKNSPAGELDGVQASPFNVHSPRSELGGPEPRELGSGWYAPQELPAHGYYGKPEVPAGEELKPQGSTGPEPLTPTENTGLMR